MATVTLTWTGTSISFDYGFSTSVQKEFGRADDGSILNEKHTISIRGQIVSSGITADARYSNLVTQMFSRAKKLATGANRVATLQAGLLVITGDSGEIVRYDSASLLSVNVSEAPEDTAGLHYQEVSMTFESYNTPSDPVSAYKLRSVSENIEYKKEENQFSYKGNEIDTEDEPYHAFTVTHTISAQGFFNNGSSKKEAFEEAYTYVTSRKKNALGTINTDAFAKSYLGSSKLEMKEYKIAGQASDVIASADISNYSEYNKIRTSSTDVTSGSYSLTTTFLLARESANIDITGNYTRDESGDASITIEGTIQGLSTKNADAGQHDKITQAKKAYDAIAGNLKSASKIYKYANSKIYDKFQIDKAGVSLRDVPLNYSFGENKSNGTITFNVTYKVCPGELKSLLDSITGALVAQATIVDNNRSGGGNDYNQIVIIPIIGRADGPVIQDMNTTKERSRNVTVDVTLEPQYRTSTNTLVRTQTLAKVNSYKPTSYSELYIQNFNESWDWIAGKYNVSIDWIYTT